MYVRPSFPIHLGLLLLVGVMVAGCGRPEPPPASLRDGAAESKGKASSAHPPTGESVQMPKDRGAVQGTVRFDGPVIPASTIIPVGTDRHVCGQEHSKEDCVIDSQSRGIRYVIINLEGKNSQEWPQTKPGYLFLDNKDCRFEPHAAVLTIGSTIEVHNSDKVAHTVHGYFGDSFNYLLPPQDARDIRLKHVVRSPGLLMIRCDVHGWMNSFIRVDRHPFHAVTDAQGCFTIKDVPIGSYTLAAWHERFGAKKTTVTIQNGQTTDVHLKYAE